ncbi:hypothetical protein GCM10007291_17220 [Gemmobacter nanjingensis]|uniref:Uncharacterized protein n=1 Tax=Gemmobacter nanjingensis TaxID=488454 RepID=A0ABQ3FCY5_9RHOB|nr:hypothetical protein [Gemmobacter nanjingensis]GHC19010.1 hypothetical protein GCM10007291_17220 [Gemmobacter nanjingensis]
MQLFEFLAAIIAAATCAGIVWGLRKLMPHRIPKIAVPLATGLGLIGTTIALEYGWYGNQVANLPEGVVVVEHGSGKQMMRPWTYLVPMTTEFTAIDTRTIAPHPANPALRLVHIYQFARWRPVEDGFLAVDCAAGRRVRITEGMEIGADGALSGADWQTSAPDDPVTRAACREG